MSNDFSLFPICLIAPKMKYYKTIRGPREHECARGAIQFSKLISTGDTNLAYTVSNMNILFYLSLSITILQKYRTEKMMYHHCFDSSLQPRGIVQGAKSEPTRRPCQPHGGQTTYISASIEWTIECLSKKPKLDDLSLEQSRERHEGSNDSISECAQWHDPPPLFGAKPFSRIHVGVPAPPKVEYTSAQWEQWPWRQSGSSKEDRKATKRTQAGLFGAASSVFRLLVETSHRFFRVQISLRDQKVTRLSSHHRFASIRVAVADV